MPETAAAVVAALVPGAAAVVAADAAVADVVAAPAADDVVDAPAASAAGVWRFWARSWWARAWCTPWALASSRESVAAKRADSAERGSMVAVCWRKVAEGATRNATYQTKGRCREGARWRLGNADVGRKTEEVATETTNLAAGLPGLDYASREAETSDGSLAIPDPQSPWSPCQEGSRLMQADTRCRYSAGVRRAWCVPHRCNPPHDSCVPSFLDSRCVCSVDLWSSKVRKVRTVHSIEFRPLAWQGIFSSSRTWLWRLAGRKQDRPTRP